MKLLVAVGLFVAMASNPAAACDQTIKVSNWKSCAVGNLSDEGGEADWKAVPVWARDKAIRPYFESDPRLLANHGLCNNRFKRVVLCLPGWEEARDKDACWYFICSGYAASRG